MSATAQNFAYIYGKKRDGAKENTLSLEQLERTKKYTARFMPKERPPEYKSK